MLALIGKSNGLSGSLDDPERRVLGRRLRIAALRCAQLRRQLWCSNFVHSSDKSAWLRANTLTEATFDTVAGERNSLRIYQVSASTQGCL